MTTRKEAHEYSDDLPRFPFRRHHTQPAPPPVYGRVRVRDGHGDHTHLDRAQTRY